MFRIAATIFALLLTLLLTVSTLVDIKEEHSEKYRIDTIDPVQKKCLADNIYHEARGESIKGQIAVASVTVNRTKSKYWPSSICEVVYEGSHRRTGCQFSWTCDRKDKKIRDKNAYSIAESVAEDVMLGRVDDPTSNSKFYHTTSIRPYWAKSKKLVESTTIGRHRFYDLRTERNDVSKTGN